MAGLNVQGRSSALKEEEFDYREAVSQSVGMGKNITHKTPEMTWIILAKVKGTGGSTPSQGFLNIIRCILFILSKSISNNRGVRGLSDFRY